MIDLMIFILLQMSSCIGILGNQKTILDRERTFAGLLVGGCLGFTSRSGHHL